jgi:hypothetical protein
MCAEQEAHQGQGWHRDQPSQPRSELTQSPPERALEVSCGLMNLLRLFQDKQVPIPPLSQPVASSRALRLLYVQHGDRECYLELLEVQLKAFEGVHRIFGLMVSGKPFRIAVVLTLTLTNRRLNP